MQVWPYLCNCQWFTCKFCHHVVSSIDSFCCTALCSVYAGAEAASAAQPSLRAAAVRATAVERPFARDSLRVNPPAPRQPVEGRQQSVTVPASRKRKRPEAADLVQTCRAGVMSKRFVRKLYSMIYLTRKGWMRLVMQPGRWLDAFGVNCDDSFGEVYTRHGAPAFFQGSKSSWRYDAYVGFCKSTVTAAMPS